MRRGENASTSGTGSGNHHVPGLGGSWVGLGFVVFSLVALVLVPYLGGKRVDEVQDRITRVLEPARRMAGELQFTQARARGALQAFLLSGEGRFRQRYVDARRREREVLDSLGVLAEEMALPLRRDLSDLADASFRWHLSHEAVLAERVDRERFLEGLSDEDDRYDEVLSATSDLQRTIAAEVSRTRERMAEARRTQFQITLGLLVLALGATAAVALLGWQLLESNREAERRRRDAVRARREADALLAATADGVFGVDTDGRCTFLNRAGSELLGWRPGELVGLEIHPRIHHTRPDGTEHPPQDCPVLEALDREAALRDADELFWRKDGSSFPARVSARPMVDGNTFRGVVVTFADMTETRAQEEALRQAVRARDEVLAVVTHDLRNPVGSIHSGASLLMEVDVGPERRREHLEMIRRSASRASRLIQDLLDVARMEGGSFPLDPVPVELEALATEAVEGVAGRAREKGVELRGGVEEDPGRIRADRDRLLQVLSNLLGNAVKFTPEGGRVELTVRGENGTVLLEVTDTGRGIEPEAVEHLFDRFWQARRADREGTGLGLAIVKGIVDAHGGVVEVTSEEGVGSTFTVRLPREPGEV